MCSVVLKFYLEQEEIDFTKKFDYFYYQIVTFSYEKDKFIHKLNSYILSLRKLLSNKKKCQSLDFNAKTRIFNKIDRSLSK